MAFARSGSVALGILGPMNERSEGNSQNMSAKGTTPSRPSVPLRSLTAMLSRDSFFSLG